MGRSVKIPALTTEASLKREMRRHLRALGFVRDKDGSLSPDSQSKDHIRRLHADQRYQQLKLSQSFVAGWTSKLIGHFADGEEIDVPRISPVLEKIDAGTWQSALFRFASLTWSIPVSGGYGRRLRYLVWDQHVGKLIGIIALGDPVFNLRARDEIIGWNARERAARLSNILDAYVLGALPPYNLLLGGKLIACLVRTRDVYDDFASTYGKTTGVISKTRRRSHLLAVTTSSSMGRSSIYNRLKLGPINYFRPLGYTDGWGHFHISDQLFDKFRTLLKSAGHPYATKNRFGDGPNWKLRTVRAALKILGLDEGLLHHGIRRQVFMSEFARNSIDLLRGSNSSPQLSALLGVRLVSEQAIERWLLPRSLNRPEFRSWRKEDIHQLLSHNGVSRGRLNSNQV